MYRTYVRQNFAVDGIDIFVVFDHGELRHLLNKDGSQTRVLDGEALSPTITLHESAARSLLDQLLQHFQGATDLHTVRADLLHERDRRDRLEDSLTRIAEAKSG